MLNPETRRNSRRDIMSKIPIDVDLLSRKIEELLKKMFNKEKEKTKQFNDKYFKTVKTGDKKDDT